MVQYLFTYRIAYGDMWFPNYSCDERVLIMEQIGFVSSVLWKSVNIIFNSIWLWEFDQDLKIFNLIHETYLSQTIYK